MALTKIMGQNFRVFVGSAAVPEATNCQVTIQGNLEDASTKDSTGGWNEEQMTSKQWSVQVDDVDASLATLRALITRFNSDSKTTVGWDQTAGAQNREAQNAAFARSGQAILNDLSINANNRTTIQVTCQYQGSGALA
jgi:predicted secreted protein